MTYYPDFSIYTYNNTDTDLHTLNIGWLDIAYKFPIGVVPDPFIARLQLFCYVSVLHMRGFHICNLCGEPFLNNQYIIRDNEELVLGGAEIRVFDRNGRVYAAPDLVYHYVVNHKYCPPEEFIQAILEGPQPDTSEYQSLIKPWLNPYRHY